MVMTSSNIVAGYQRLRGPCSLHVQGEVPITSLRSVRHKPEAQDSNKHVFVHNGTYIKLLVPLTSCSVFCRVCHWLAPVDIEGDSNFSCECKRTYNTTLSKVPELKFRDINFVDYAFLLNQGLKTLTHLRGRIQKFTDWVDNEIDAYNNKHSLRSNTKGYVGKTH
jgi:hypothetical protein